MTAIEEACMFSCENWIDSFPQKIPKHKFSREHKKAINKILYSDNKKYKVTFSKRNIKILLIAAVLLSLAATVVFAVPKSREFIVNKFSNHSEYNITDTDNIKDVKSLTVNYIPKGFEVTEEHTASGFCILKYENGEKSFSIKKLSLDFTINYDTEKYKSEEIKINGITAVYYKPDNDMHGIIFNNGEYIYSVSGHISKDEIVKVAQNIE
ncbi:DUF4367 domain-containing protein [uncultured Eubacterium sp.]|uniref:DUF4367 domain-containing protein n=1 Tax=uncultured Eubacterium sp. TaxID=165185 RepID=UPI00258C1DF3|nr:DUF4367 domain-containing protein [uncultured Eubacterium sp.]